MTRRQERENIYRILFRAEFHKPEEMEEQLALARAALRESSADEDAPVIGGGENLSEEEEAYIMTKMERVLSHLDEIDAKISESAIDWSFERIGKAELAILRLATYEVLFDEDVPDKVAINEAVELTKIYCNEDARGFVNGILGKIEGNK